MLSENATRQTLIEMIKEARYREALDYFCNHKYELPFWERGFLFRLIEDGIKENSHVTRSIIFLAVVVELNALLGNMICSEVLDMLSFLGSKNIYFQYYKMWIPPIVNMIFLVMIIFDMIKNILYPQIVLKEKFRFKSLVASGTTFAYLIAYIIAGIIPLAQDYHYVQDNTYEVREISTQERINMIQNEYYKEGLGYGYQDFEQQMSQRRAGVKEFHPEYQEKPWLEEKKARYMYLFKHKAYVVHVDDETELKMSEWQKNWIGIEDNTGNLDLNDGIRIKYLPNAAIVLDVEEMQEL